MWKIPLHSLFFVFFYIFVYVFFNHQYLVGPACFIDSEAVQDVIHDLIDHRHHNQRKEKRADESTDDDPSQSVFPLRAGAGSQRDRQHTEYHGDSRHQNGAQPRLVRQNQRFARGLPFCLEVVGKVYKDDGVLGYQPDQHNQTENGEYIQGIVGERESQQRPDNGERDGEHHDERIHEAVVQRYHDEVHEQDRRQQRDTQRTEPFGLLLHVAAPHVTDAAGSRQFVELGFEFGRDGTNGSPNHLRLILHRGAFVAPLQLARPRPFVDTGELRQPHQLAHIIRKRQVAHVFDILAIIVVETDVDVVLVFAGAEFTVGIAAECGLHGGAHGL